MQTEQRSGALSPLQFAQSFEGGAAGAGGSLAVMRRVGRMWKKEEKKRKRMLVLECHFFGNRSK